MTRSSGELEGWILYLPELFFYQKESRMSDIEAPKTRKDFLDIIQKIAPAKHRYSVFSDFVIMSAICLHNRIVMNQDRENEYLTIIRSYTKKEDQHAFSTLLHILIELLDEEPVDQLGGIFMELGFGEDLKGQFFTPNELSKLMAQMTFAECIESLKTQPFIKMSEPACGAGGMILPAVDMLIKAKYNPATTFFVQAVDVDRVSALMCYIQLALWNVPAEVIVGNSLSLEVREVWYTPAYYLYDWKNRLNFAESIDKWRKAFAMLSTDVESTTNVISIPATTQEEVHVVDVESENEISPPSPLPIVATQEMVQSTVQIKGKKQNDQQLGFFF